ncbi:MAG: hypothetical protein E3J86_07120 [Candidatus Thorarchaeota archaeon]|nr:MAG: hypothetical protein E3J86_07120 [Candidatus Thorarchaeota archaeon]
MSAPRITFEEALEKVLSKMGLNVPMNVNQITELTGIGWITTKNVLNIVMEIQDFLAAHEIIVIEGRPRKIVLAQIRVRMSVLPSEVADWFIDSEYFTTLRKEYTTEEVRKQVAPEGKIRKTPLETSIHRVVEALKLGDELSILELSKRTVLNRRTVERVLALLIRFQNKISETMLVEIEESGYIREHRPSLYELDNQRMIYLLKKRYIPELVKDISDKSARELLRLQ